jgi:hypothetical protein
MAFLAPRPPDAIAFVARVHWLVAASIVAMTTLLLLVLTQLPVEFGSRTFYVSFAVGAVYAMAGTLVWNGHPFGRILSYPCSMLYLPRPQLGLEIFRIMGSAEYRAHFVRRPH